MARNKTKFEQQQALQMLGNSKEEREKLNFEYRRDTLMSFDSVFLDSIHQRNKKLLLGFMEYIAYSSMAKRTCQSMKTNLILFFKWNLTYNDNITFRMVTKKQGEDFFLFLKTMGYTYVRVKCIKSDICTLADYCEFVLGKDEYNSDGTSNQWFSYNHKWREVDIQQREEDEYGFRKTNVQDFSDRLDPLRFYLKSTKDYMGLVILDFCWLGKDLLLLQENDNRFNRQLPSVKKYLKWKERVGAKDISDVLITIRPDGSYAPMSLADLRRYTKMFSVFLGKEFIIC